MNIGLMDVDGHNFPNLALMKISAYHKSRGDNVSWWWGWDHYDILYKSKVFDDTYSPDIPDPANADRIIKGGTGYNIKKELPYEIDHMYPDYSLYPQYTKDTAYGYLTRGCPNACEFCLVCEKEGRKSRQVAYLSEWWRGQKNIVLLDPNLLACKNKMFLLDELIKSGAWVDFNQGIDCRLLTPEIIDKINRIKTKKIHFAWDLMKNSDKVVAGLNLYKALAARKPHGKWGTVYMLTNFNTTTEEDLYRVYKLREMGFDPYPMVYDKPNAPQITRDLQRWVLNRRIFGKVKTFDEYLASKGRSVHRET